MSLICRQLVACGRCGYASSREAELISSGVGLSADDVAAAVEQGKWASYDDVPDATEEEIAQYPSILATFDAEGYPYLTGVRRLMELYKKKASAMATFAFQVLVRHDP